MRGRPKTRLARRTAVDQLHRANSGKGQRRKDSSRGQLAHRKLGEWESSQREER